METLSSFGSQFRRPSNLGEFIDADFLGGYFGSGQYHFYFYLVGQTARPSAEESKKYWVRFAMVLV